MPQNTFFHKLAIFWSAKKMTQRHFFPTLHPLSPVFFATATVLAFVLLHNSRFNFHCYTQREATPAQKSAQKWHCNFLRERLQRAFTRANQLHWTAQYWHGPISFHGNRKSTLSWHNSRSDPAYLQQCCTCITKQHGASIPPHIVLKGITVYKPKQNA